MTCTPLATFFRFKDQIYVHKFLCGRYKATYYSETSKGFNPDQEKNEV